MLDTKVTELTETDFLKYIGIIFCEDNHFDAAPMQRAASK